MFFDVRCPICGRSGAAPCDQCASQLRPAPDLPIPAGLDDLVAPIAYTGVGRELVARLKYRNARAVLPALANAIAHLVDPATVDVVTWAPTSAARRRERGYDQARLLARAVARRLHRPCRSLLSRQPGPAQTGRPKRDRLAGPTFTISRNPPRRVLVVDDVVTTGATLIAAARVLKAAGALEVKGAAAARTPLKATDTLSDAAIDA
ncbi:MAG: ComF family protein [Acidimicrobiia bacterium]|nr:ComF family protein [Acidimicrobiia bacterium]